MRLKAALGFTFVKEELNMKTKDINRMLELYDKKTNDTWNGTKNMTTEEEKEYQKLVEYFSEKVGVFFSSCGE